MLAARTHPYLPESSSVYGCPRYPQSNSAKTMFGMGIFPHRSLTQPQFPQHCYRFELPTKVHITHPLSVTVAVTTVNPTAAQKTLDSCVTSVTWLENFFILL